VKSYRASDRKPVCEVEVDYVDGETSLAIHVGLTDGSKHWIPKSVIHDDSEVYDKKNGQGSLVIMEWFAEQHPELDA